MSTTVTGASGATGATSASGSTGASAATGSTGATGAAAKDAALSGAPLDAIGVLSGESGDEGMLRIEIIQDGQVVTLEALKAAGRVIAFHARLRDAIDLIRSIGKPVGTAAKRAAAAVTPANEAARIVALEARCTALEAEIVKMGGTVPKPPAPLLPAAPLTVATPAPQIAGRAFRLSGTYTGIAPSGIDVQTDMGPFGQTLSPVVGNGLWSVMVTLADEGPHTLTVRGTGTVTPTATTGSFVVGAGSAALTVKPPVSVIAGGTLSLSGTYAGATPTAIEAAVDGGAFLAPPTPATIGNGAWSASWPAPVAGTHTVVVRNAAAPAETASTGSFLVAPAAA